MLAVTQHCAHSGAFDSIPNITAMPIAVAAPPQPVPVFSGFDYVAVDEARHRAYAAHTASKRLLIVDTSSGAVAGQVDVGPMHGLAVDPASGDVFTGNGTDRTLSKVDPVAMKVLSSVDVPGDVDAIAYDPATRRVYADQSGGPNVYVIDGATMKLIGTIVMPADDLESPAVDPKSGRFYQNLANGGGFAIVDPTTLSLITTISTPQLEKNHPLVFAQGANQVIVGGVNGVLSAYTSGGTLVGSTNVQPRIDQCSTGSQGSLIVCAGRGIVSVVAAKNGSGPELVARFDTGHTGVHTAGIDETTGDIWIVWSDTKGDWVQRLRFTP
jgi:DNA-binding beta-propeller fold protein YncE